MRNSLTAIIAVWSLIPVGFAPAAAEQPTRIEVAELSREKPVDFALEILPILRKNCLACHNSRDADAEFNLETPATIAKGGENGQMVVPGNAEKSPLMVHTRQIEKPFMPPRRNKVSAGKLTPHQIGLLKLWIDEGAEGEVPKLSQQFEWQPLAFDLVPIYTTAVSPDGQYAAAGRGNQIFLYHLPTRRLAARLFDPALAMGNPTAGGTAHRDVVQSLTFSPDGQVLASGGYRVTKLWQRQMASPARRLHLLPGGESVMAFGVAIGPGSVLVAGSGGSVQAIDLQSAMPHWRDQVPGQAAGQLKVSPDGNRVAVLFADGKVRLWETATGERVTRESTPMAGRAVAWLNNRQLVSAHPEGVLKSWAAINPEKNLHEWKSGGDITALAVLPGGKTVLVGRADNKVIVVSVGDGKQIGELDHDAPVAGLRVRADGKQVATFGGPTVKLWSIGKWTMTAQLEGNPLAAESVARAEQALAFVNAETAYHKANVENKQKELKKDQDTAKKAAGNLLKHKKTLADKTKEKAESEVILNKLADEIAGLPEKIEIGTKAKTDADAALKAAQTQVTTAKAALAKANEVTAQAAATKTKLTTRLMELGSAAKNARQLAADARTSADEAEGDGVLAMQAAVAAALAKRKANEFESALDQFEPTKQQLAKAETEAQATTRSLAEAVANLKPAQDELEGKQKALAALGERNKKTPEEKKALDKKIADAGNAIDKAEREVDLAKSEVGFTSKNVKIAESNLEKAKSAQAMAGKLPAQREAALAEARSVAATGMQDWLDVTYSGDASMVYTLSVDGRIQAWSTDTGVRSHQLGTTRQSAMFIRRSGDGRLAVAGESAEMVEIATEPGWTLARSIGAGDDSPFEDRVIALDFSPDGKRLATGGGFPSRGGEVYIWNVQDGSEELRIPMAHSDTVCSLAFSPDGGRLATGGTDRFARVFETDRGRELHALEGHTGHVLGVSWQKNGRVLATGGADKAVKIWNLLNGEQKKSFGGFNKEVTSVHFLGIGTQVVVSAGDHVVKVVKADGNDVRRLPDTGTFMHTSDVTPDGELATAGGFDGILRVWEVNTGKLLHKFTPSTESTKVAVKK